MPWGFLGRWVDDPTRAPDPPAQAAGIEAQTHYAAQQLMNQTYNVILQNHQAFGVQAVDPFHEIITIQPATLTTTRAIDYVALLMDFNRAFDHGLREIIVDDHIFYSLWSYLNTGQDPTDVDQTHVRFATAGGYIIIKRVHQKNEDTINDDFARYMEDVDGTIP